MTQRFTNLGRGCLLGLVSMLVGGALSCGPAVNEGQLVAPLARRLLLDPAVVVSQVYGGGSNTGALWQSDFVELFNRSAASVSVDGWSLQYASATGTGLFASSVTALAGTVQPGQYYLIRMAGATANGEPLPTADAVGTTALSATSGKIALVSQTVGLACNGGSTPCDSAAEAQIIDLVGYGSASYAEGVAAPAISNTTALIRGDEGCTDTNSNATDFSTAAPAPRNSASPIAPCGVDTAPFVAATLPLPSAADVAPSVVVTVTFSEPVRWDAASLAFVCSGSGSVSYEVTGGPTVFSIIPEVALILGESCSLTLPGAMVHDEDAVDPPDTMTDDLLLTFSIVSGPGAYRIRDVQGHSHVSPLSAQNVSALWGLVTVLRSNGFHMQDPEPDEDDATSEGLFVYTGSVPSVAVGDEVLVSGPVSEFRPSCSSCSPSSSAYSNLTTTEINRPTSVTVLSRGNALPSPVLLGGAPGERLPPSEVIDDDAMGSVESPNIVLDPSKHGIDFYESLEGMRVAVVDALAVGPTDTFSATSHELVVVAREGAFATGRTVRRGVVLSSKDFNPERIMLADSLGVLLPNADVGDILRGTTVGVVDYSYGNFKLLVSEPVPELERGGVAREVLSLGASLASQITIATVNTENLDPSDGPERFAALASLVIQHLQAPDVVALEEIQDNSGATDDGVVDASETMGLLIDAVASAGGPLYGYRQLDPGDNQDGGEAGGNIRVVFMFRSDRGLVFVDRPGAVFDTPTEVVEEQGAPALRFSPARIDPTNAAFVNSRKPLVGEFRYNGRTFFVIANHFNSKGGDQPLFGRFQPPVLTSETQRLAQAAVVAKYVDQIQSLDAGALIVVLGDLNDFSWSAPVVKLRNSGLTALIDTLPDSERYTYIYEGNSQALDHILVSAALIDAAEYDVVHVNAEFVEQQSDHDPSVARLVVGVSPAVVSTPVVMGVQGQPYVYDVDATANPLPIYSLETAPSGMTIEAATGVITWLPLVVPGDYVVVVRVSNGIGVGAVQQFAVSIVESSTAQRVRPTVGCVERAERGLLTARFGYYNPNPFPVVRDIGFANRFFPAPFDRGQPRVFDPGEVRNAFVVSFPWPAVAWLLDQRPAVAFLSPRYVACSDARYRRRVERASRGE